MLFHSDMKYSIRALCAAATMLFGLTLDAFSQSGDTKGVHINTYIEDFNYETMSGTVTIESFVEDKIIDPDATVKPFDIVLVLDVSGSMSNTVSGVNVYKPLTSTSYTYKSYGDKTKYYYLYEGKYYQVSRGKEGNKRYLRFNTGSSYHYLTSAGLSDQPSNVTTDSGTIWTGVLYTQSTATRLDIMKSAATKFVDIIDSKSSATVDNRIAIFTFDSSVTNASSGLVSVKDNASTLKNKISRFVTGSGTYTGDGMTAAYNIINGLTSDELSNREQVVILFSDGDAESGQPNKAIKAGYDIINKGAVVYSVALSAGMSSDGDKMMNYISSNYPNAQSTSNHGSQASSDYYFKSSTGSDLEDIFVATANKLDPPTIYFDGETTVKDSFDSSIALDLPQGASSIRVYTADCTGYNSATDTYTFGTLQAYSGLDITLDSTTNGFNTGNFNYSDNWVGVTGTNNDPHGKELVLKIPFKFSPAAAHLTEDELVVNINGDTPPELELGTRKHATAKNLAALPFKSLTVVKDGLHKGESAIFAIDRNPLGSETARVHVNRIVLTGTSDDGTSVSYRVPFLNPKATYIVTEHTDWSWTYTPDVTGGRTTTQTKDMSVSGTATVNFKDDKIAETKLPRNSETIVYHRQ